MTEATAVTARADTLPESPERTETDTQSLVRFAIEQQVPVEVLERLVALQERVSDRNARSSFFAAMSRFQAECGEVPQNKQAQLRTKSGATFGFGYTSLDALTRHVRPILSRHGLSYTWDTTLEDKLVTITATVRHIDGHEQAASFAAPVESQGADMSAAQNTAKVVTYGKRQALLQVLGVASTDDNEEALAAQSPTIAESQAADLEALISEVGADRGKFLRWLRVDALSEVKQSAYAGAVEALERKRGPA